MGSQLLFPFLIQDVTRLEPIYADAIGGSHYPRLETIRFLSKHHSNLDNCKGCAVWY